MRPNEIAYCALLSIIIFPSLAYANPMTPVIGTPGLFIALAIESVLLTLLVSSYGIRPFKFMLIWFLITCGTFGIMVLFIRLDKSIYLGLTILLAEFFVVISEAFILRWLLKQSFVLKREAKKMGIFRALIYSFIINIVSFISGYIMYFLSVSSRG